VDVRRGDIVIVELDPARGSEQRGTRPCLVVQNDIGNENAPTTIIVPFTTSFDDERYPFEVLVTAEESHLREDSVAMCSQIRTVSVEDRIETVAGSIPDERMEDVDTALEYSLGLRGQW
jgi:mRNA interferase MazF